MIAFMGTNIMFWICQGIRSTHKELELFLKENNFAAYSLRSIAAKVFTRQKTQKKQNSKKPLLG